MISETYDTQVGASATVKNALEGTTLALAPDHGVLSILGVEESTAAGKIKVSCFIGTERVLNGRAMRRTDDLCVDRSKDILGEFPVVKGSPMIVQLVEGAAAAMDLAMVFEFTAVSLPKLMAEYGS